MGKRFTALAPMILLMMGCPTALAEDSLEWDDLLEDPPLWERFFSARAGVGHHDNLLYSDLQPKGSAFLATGLDATWVRLPLNGWEVALFLNLDDRRYFDGGTVARFSPAPGGSNQTEKVSGERTALALAQVKRDLSSRWQAGGAVQYFHQDQVIDVSVTEVELGAVPVIGHQLLARLEGWWRPGGRFTGHTRFTGQRQWFAGDELDDYWQFGPRLAASWELSTHSTLELTQQLERRDFDTREELAIDGTPLPGTRLSYLTHNTGLEWQHHLDDRRRWRLVTRVGHGYNDDLATGYFNHHRASGMVQLRYRAPRWEVRAQASHAWYWYDVQRSDSRPEQRRERRTFQTELRANRRLTKSLRGYASYEFERADSNLSFDTYTVNSFQAGLEWEF